MLLRRGGTALVVFVAAGFAVVAEAVTVVAAAAVVVAAAGFVPAENDAFFFVGGLIGSKVGCELGFPP